jgi:uncharacterized protein YqjF (DUF2071 family)
MAEPERRFMTTHWRAVLGVTYPADEALLAPHLPPGCEIDRLEGSPRVSVVAFRFRHTRVGGVPIPWHVNFPEINLRFYVRIGGQRAVVFIREFVSRPAIALTAKLFYNEPYRTIRMKDWLIAPTMWNGSRLGVRHRFGPGLRNRLEAWADPVAQQPAPDSSAYWLTHHELGVGRGHRGRVSRYRVEHDVWGLHAIRDLRVEVDFAALYGAQWGYLADAQPSHVTLASGSAVQIYSPVDPR